MSDRRNPLTLLGLAVVAMLLVLAPAASARSRDRNHDRIPDRWETTHHLSLGVNQANKDQDRDGMRNRAEFKAGTDPRDSDTDDDGVRDGREDSGTIVSFTGGQLTIKLFRNDQTVAGTVDDRTELECGTAAPGAAGQASVRHGGDDGPGNDSGHDGDATSEPEDAGDVHGDGADEHQPENRGDDDHGSAPSCATDKLIAGTVVHGAELSTSPSGLHYDELKLAAAPSA
jgi:hypothetical protein